jgi:hypothetical protein
MIRGDFGVVGVVLVVSACSSRAADLAASDGGVRERGHTAADAMATGEAVSSEQTVESLDRPASSGPGDRDPTREVPATSDHASDAGATTQSGGDEPTASGDAGAFENLFEVSAHLANEEDPHAPTTVGIVTWSTTAGPPSAATIEFGLTTDYGSTAPVDLTHPKLRTVLIGMKPERVYHYRIRASVDGRDWVSQDFTLTTGFAPAVDVVSIASYEVLSPQDHDAGFIVTSHWNGEYRGMVFILDPDGEIVWWYRSGLNGGVAKAEISADGRDVWMISAANNGGEKLARVGLDGLRPQFYSDIGASHDVVAIERDVMALIDYASYNTALEINRSGAQKIIFESSAFPERGPAPHHLNAIDYDDATQSYVVSSHNTDVYLFPRGGSTTENTRLLTAIVGDGDAWGGYQHGVELLPDNHLLLFANKKADERGSSVIEYDLDDGAEVWRYQGDESTANFGDVQRLPGGNTLVTYSNAGVMVEVTPERETVFQLTANDYLGYATWRRSLYPSSAHN